MTTSTILSSVYGYKPSLREDAIVITMEKAMTHLAVAALPGSELNTLFSFFALLMHLDFYVNIIPWLKYVPTWFPGASWKRNVHTWRAEKEAMVKRPYEWTKAQMAWHDLKLLTQHRVDVFLGGGNCSAIYSQQLII